MQPQWSTDKFRIAFLLFLSQRLDLNNDQFFCFVEQSGGSDWEKEFSKQHFITVCDCRVERVKWSYRHPVIVKPVYIKLHVQFVLALIRHTLDLIINSELRSIFCPFFLSFDKVLHVILRTLTECHFNGWRVLFLSWLVC